MRPVMQTKLGKVDGNCLQACIASLLEVPVEEMPDVISDDDWVDETNATLKPYGYYYMSFVQNPEIQFPLRGYHVIHGDDGPHGHNHCVVGKCGEPVHDPHPSKPGVNGTITYGILVPLSPATPTATTEGCEGCGWSELGGPHLLCGSCRQCTRMKREPPTDNFTPKTGEDGNG